MVSPGASGSSHPLGGTGASVISARSAEIAPGLSPALASAGPSTSSIAIPRSRADRDRSQCSRGETACLRKRPLPRKSNPSRSAVYGIGTSSGRPPQRRFVMAGSRSFWDATVHMSHGHRPYFWLILAACLCLALVSACGSETGSATADERAALATRGHPRIGPVLPVAVVPRPIGTDFSEGIAVSKHGDLYFGLALSGGIYRRAPDGAVSLFARLPTGNGVLLGLALDESDVLYAALTSFDDASSGVWRIAQGGTSDLVMAMGAAALPNALAFDEQGNLYATDSSGTVWRLARDGTG